MSKLMLECKLHGEAFPVSAAVYEHLRQYCVSGECTPKFKRRSHLFIPLNKSKFLDKVGRGEVMADGFIWDLEDSIPKHQKHLARSALANIPPKQGLVEYNIRLNCGDIAELDRDVEAISGLSFDSITLPKGESAAEILRLMRLIGEDRSYIVTIETIKGLDAVNDIACVLRPGRDALGFGVGDMASDLGLERHSTCNNLLFQQIMGRIAIAGKRHHLDLFDSVSSQFNDPEIARREAMLSCGTFGYTGKKLISPRQLEVINQVFSPPKALIATNLATMASFLCGTDTNAHVVGGEYKGWPAFKAADNYIKKLLQQGYLTSIQGEWGSLSQKDGAL